MHRETIVGNSEDGEEAVRVSGADAGGASRIFRKTLATSHRIVSARSRIKTRRRPIGWKYAARWTARSWPIRSVGRATGFLTRTGSGTRAHTSGGGGRV